MKFIGQTSEGTKLVEVSTAEWFALQVLLGLVADAAPASPAVVAPSAPEVVMRSKHVALKPVKDKPAKLAKVKAEAPKVGKLVPCAVCGKLFAKSTSQKTCSPACRDERKRRQDAERSGKPPAAATEPVAKPDRIAAIRAAAENVGMKIRHTTHEVES